MSLDELIARLRDRDLVSAEAETKLAHWLAREDKTRGDPFYIRALAALGAWAAAVCFITFLAMADLIDTTGFSLPVWGLIFLVAAAAIRGLSGRTFLVQLALAFCSAGHTMLLGYAADMVDHDFPEIFGAMAIMQGAATAIMYWVYRDRVYRFLAPAVFFTLATVWAVAEGRSAQYLLDLFVAAETILAGAVLAGRMGGDGLRPLGYASALAVPGTVLIYTIPDRALGIASYFLLLPGWRIGLFLALALCVTFAWAAGWKGLRRAEWFWIAVPAAFALGFVTNPGVLAAIGLLVLGYAQGDKVLLGLGFAFLPIFLAVYYYDLDVSLAYKSYVLAGSGLVLLGVRRLAASRPWARETDR
jgi:hypothetical protein